MIFKLGVKVRGNNIVGIVSNVISPNKHILCLIFIFSYITIRPLQRMCDVHSVSVFCILCPRCFHSSLTLSVLHSTAFPCYTVNTCSFGNCLRKPTWKQYTLKSYPLSFCSLTYFSLSLRHEEIQCPNISHLRFCVQGKFMCTFMFMSDPLPSQREYQVGTKYLAELSPFCISCLRSKSLNKTLL